MSFLKWCLDQGCLLKRGTISDIPGYGSGIVATADVVAGVDVCIVPLDLIMNVHSARKAPFWSIVEAMKLDFSSDHEIVLVHLVYERNNIHSRWQPYIAAVGVPRVPLLASPEELACIRGTSMHLELTKMNKAIDRLAAKMSVVEAARPGVCCCCCGLFPRLSRGKKKKISVLAVVRICVGPLPCIRLGLCLCFGLTDRRRDVWFLLQTC